MNVWLCPVRPRSWRIIKKNKIFGAPKNASTIFSKVQIGDLLVIHVLRPINGIVAICRIVSEIFESDEDLWGQNRYPLRVRLEIISKYLRTEANSIPLSSLFGKIGNPEIEIHPYMGHTFITKITVDQYERLVKSFDTILK